MSLNEGMVSHSLIVLPRLVAHCFLSVQKEGRSCSEETSSVFETTSLSLINF